MGIILQNKIMEEVVELENKFLQKLISVIGKGFTGDDIVYSAWDVLRLFREKDERYKYDFSIPFEKIFSWNYDPKFGIPNREPIIMLMRKVTEAEIRKISGKFPFNRTNFVILSDKEKLSILLETDEYIDRVVNPYGYKERNFIIEDSNYTIIDSGSLTKSTR